MCEINPNDIYYLTLSKYSENYDLLKHRLYIHDDQMIFHKRVIWYIHQKTTLEYEYNDTKRQNIFENWNVSYQEINACSVNISVKVLRRKSTAKCHRNLKSYQGQSWKWRTVHTLLLISTSSTTNAVVNLRIGVKTKTGNGLKTLELQPEISIKVTTVRLLN